MNLQYANTKEVECYKNYVLHPEDRKNQRAFCKHFDISLMEKAKRLHDRLQRCKDVGDYNKTFGGNNRIELKQGSKNNEPLVLKVRIDKSYRKFFNHIIGNTKEELLLTSDWQGNFKLIESIYVIGVNKHDYKSI